MLTRLSSETGLLVQNISFVPGINIIYGKYSGDKQAKDINGIGKSSLVRLINYMLLSDSAEREFSKEKYNFFRKENHTLLLEFKKSGKEYFIKREFESEKIFFGNSYSGLIEYSKQELVRILSNLYFPVENNLTYLEGNRFRTLMQFFIKDDIQNKGRKEATNFFNFTPSAAERAIYNFYLLGLPTKSLINFSEVAKEYKQYNDALQTFEEKLKNESGHTVEEYRSERLRIEASISSLRKKLEGYDFRETHKDLDKKLSLVVNQINEKSQEFHQLSKKLKNIKESYQQNPDIDKKQVQKLYNEVFENFGDAVKKTLDEITQFKTEILENRNKFLVGREKELESAINDVFKELSSLEEIRTTLLKNLREKGVLDKLENTYEELIREQTLFEKQNQILIQVDEYNRILSDQEIVLSTVRKDISDEIQNSQSSLNELRQLFIEILASAIFMDEKDAAGYFDIALSHNNRKGNLPFKIDVNIPKSSSVGQEVLKIIAYDLMIYINSIKKDRPLPDFLIHDGVFHGMSHRTMVNILNYIYKKHLELFEVKNFQYIATFSEDEVEVPLDKRELYGQFNFTFEDRKIIELEDIESKMLFKRDIRD